MSASNKSDDRRLTQIILILVPIVIISLLFNYSIVISKPTFNFDQKAHRLISSEKIEIYNDIKFGPAGYGFPGQGTEVDPFLIESYKISGAGRTLIHIQDTTAYFIIRDCLLDGIDRESDGILLYNVSNGIIENNIIEYCFHGISLEFSSDNLVIQNDILRNFIGLQLATSSGNKIINNRVGVNPCFGIEIFDSVENEVRGNSVFQNDAGIVVSEDSAHNQILENKVFDNTWEGIGLHSADYNNVSYNHIFDCNSGIILYEYSDYNEITRNEINNNIAEGIGLNFINDGNQILYNEIYINGVGVTLASSSDNNSVIGNFIRTNELYGIHIGSTSCENLIKWNHFMENWNEHVQAIDAGTNNSFDYNYWSDWIVPDALPPYGIVDYPYTISGQANNEDLHPRTTVL